MSKYLFYIKLYILVMCIIHMVEIYKTVKYITLKFNRKRGLVINKLGIIRFPKFFLGKTISVSFQDETIDEEHFEAETRNMNVINGGTVSCVTFPSKYIGRRCNINFSDNDVFDYFKFRYSK